MEKHKVSRGQLKHALDQANWDLFDKLLEVDSSSIDDNSMYTDDWGSWWGFLLHCIFADQVDGVRILLKHGADQSLASWGDGIPTTPLEAAADKAAILALLTAAEPPTYIRKTEPELPQLESPEDPAVNRQGVVRDQTGMVFPAENFEDEP